MRFDTILQCSCAILSLIEHDVDVEGQVAQCVLFLLAYTNKNGSLTSPKFCESCQPRRVPCYNLTYNKAFETEKGDVAKGDEHRGRVLETDPSFLFITHRGPTL